MNVKSMIFTGVAVVMGVVTMIMCAGWAMLFVSEPERMSLTSLCLASSCIVSVFGAAGLLAYAAHITAKEG